MYYQSFAEMAKYFPKTMDKILNNKCSYRDLLSLVDLSSSNQMKLCEVFHSHPGIFLMFISEQSQIKSDKTLVTHINSIRFNCNQTLKNFKI